MCRRPFAPALLLTALTFLCALPALALDDLGIFWDAGYTQDSIEISAGTVVTGYLVLKDPTAPGALGWECRIDHTGPGQFVSWDLEGQTINVGSGNEFSVGIGGDPLPATPDGILLATGQYFYPEIAPVEISLGPIYRASIPGEMSYIPADEPGTLRVLGTVTGLPVVAHINGDAPVIVVSPETVNFGTVPVGSTPVRSFTVRNEGGGTAVVAPSLPADCPEFTLVGNTGPHYLGANDAVTFEVRYDALTLGTPFCAIDLGPGLPPVQVGGTAREPIISWNIYPVELDFGDVGVGSRKSLSINVQNTGETAIPWDPVLSEPIPGLSIVHVSFPDAIPVGSTALVTVEFEPVDLVDFDILLELGGPLPAVRVAGYSREAQVRWYLSPTFVHFDEVAAGVRHSRQIYLSNRGEVPLDLFLEIEDPAQGFTTDLAGARLLQPGHYLQFSVHFETQVPGSFGTRLLFGGPIRPMNLTATVPLGDEPCLVTPPVLDFGEVTVGETYYLDLAVTNQQAAPLDVHPVAPQSWLDVLGAPATLDLGETAHYSVKFQPPFAGNYATAIQIGPEACFEVPVTAVAADPSCLVAPGPLDFGIVAVDQVHFLTLELKNPFTTPLDVAPVSDGDAFTVVEGPATIPAGGTRAFTVRFAPTGLGVHEATIDLGAAACEALTVTGEAAEPSCQVSTTLLAFGTIPMGTSATRYVDVFNTGPARIALDPQVEGSAFDVAGGASSLAPGEGATVAVTFRPLSQGSVQGFLGFGSNACEGVVLTGTGDAPTEPGTNQVGIFFDQDPYASIEYEVASGAPEMVTCYLVLNDPSDLAGVLAWECAFAVEGEVIVVGWEITGTGINVGDSGDFIVGLAQPLPWSPQILLATGTLLAQVPSSEGALLKLRPIHTPSLPGQMAYASGADPGVLIPMITTTGSEVVAIIAGSSPLPVELPSPLARMAAGEVRLEWSLAGGAGEGCHVWRRGPDGAETRLTAEPVAPAAGRFTFVDRPSGYPEGTLLAYSYSTVTGGVEGPRSPAVEVRLTGIPALRTRLLANVPNPFNPSTEVRFQLGTPGRVRVSVYDLTGRLVRDLADGTLGAGPHHRVWDGRDRRGRPVPSGAYYLRLETPEAADARKMLLLK